MTKKRSHALLLAVALLSTSPLVSGCFSDRQAPSEAGHSAPPAMMVAKNSERKKAAVKQKEIGSAPSLAETTERKLIQTAELHLEVREYAKARAAIDTRLREAKGYLSQADIRHSDGRVSRAELILRIPREKLSAFLHGTAELGSIMYETLNSQDVTDQYFDTKARLNNARKLEARLLELMTGRTEKVKDLLEVERELARVRQEIERYQGGLLNMDKKVAYSTLKLTLNTKRIYTAGAPRPFGDRLGTMLSRSLDTMLNFGRSLVLAIVVLLPWLPPLALFGFLLRRFIRYLLRRRAKAIVFKPAS